MVIVFNGEIYNYRELIPELTALGHVFRTRSDTEVIVHAWEQWGEACVDRFRGMFAFALWDERRQTLFLARDRLGVKPLFYAALPDGTWLFGSELKALLAHGGLTREIDPRSVEDYFTLGYVPEPRTIFTSAHKLPPGHTLTAAPRPAGAGAAPLLGRALHRRQPDLAPRTRRPSWSHRLQESVRLRMISEVPLGAFLSGGVDSSAVVAMMAGAVRRAGEHLLDLVRRSGVRRNALRAAGGRALQHRHFVDRVETDDFDLIDTLAALYDEPYADSSAIPTYRVCQLARRHVTVALSGDGGDESFGGYRRYRCT